MKIGALGMVFLRTVLLVARVRVFLQERLMGTSDRFEIKKEVFTVPNLITGFGIVMVGVYVYQYMTDTALWLIPITSLVIYSSDWIDGITADKLNQHSRLGKFLDPARDRLHAVAFLGNLLWIGAQDVLLPLAILIVAEVWIALFAVGAYFLVGAGSIRVFDKTRAQVNWVVILAVLVQYYWLDTELVSYTLLVFIMTAGSLVALIAYAMRFRAIFHKRI